MNPAARRHSTARSAVRLEYLTLALAAGEALVALVSGLLAGSVALIAFGADSPAFAAAAFSAHRRWSTTGFLVANPVDEYKQLDATLHDAALDAALAHAEASGAAGKEVTPVVLAEFARFTAGASVRVNRDLVVSNAALAGRIAVELARLA